MPPVPPLQVRHTAPLPQVGSRGAQSTQVLAINRTKCWPLGSGASPARYDCCLAKSLKPMSLYSKRFLPDFITVRHHFYFTSSQETDNKRIPGDSFIML